MPFSYQGKLKSDEEKSHTYSQSVDSNLSADASTVNMLLEKKGNVVLSVGKTDTISHAVTLLREKHIGALVVADDHGKLEGIISERDIVRKLADGDKGFMDEAIQTIMTKNVVTCHPGDSMIKVLQLMTDGRFRHIPVVENEMLVGLITIGDMVNFRLKELEYEALKMKQMIVG